MCVQECTMVGWDGNLFNNCTHIGVVSKIVILGDINGDVEMDGARLREGVIWVQYTKYKLYWEWSKYQKTIEHYEFT